VLTALAREDAKLGLVFLDMRRAAADLARLCKGHAGRPARSNCVLSWTMEGRRHGDLFITVADSAHPPWKEKGSESPGGYGWCFDRL